MLIVGGNTKKLSLILYCHRNLVTSNESATEIKSEAIDTNERGDEEKGVLMNKLDDTLEDYDVNLKLNLRDI